LFGLVWFPSLQVWPSLQIKALSSSLQSSPAIRCPPSPPPRRGGALSKRSRSKSVIVQMHSWKVAASPATSSPAFRSHPIPISLPFKSRPSPHAPQPAALEMMANGRAASSTFIFEVRRICAYNAHGRACRVGDWVNVRVGSARVPPRLGVRCNPHAVPKLRNPESKACHWPLRKTTHRLDLGPRLLSQRGRSGHEERAILQQGAEGLLRAISPVCAGFGQRALPLPPSPAWRRRAPGAGGGWSTERGATPSRRQLQCSWTDPTDPTAFDAWCRSAAGRRPTRRCRARWGGRLPARAPPPLFGKPRCRAKRQGAACRCRCDPRRRAGAGDLRRRDRCTTNPSKLRCLACFAGLKPLSQPCSWSCG
jgi:hypothetical protein